jgi:predicted HTH transcriptional regulator
MLNTEGGTLAIGLDDDGNVVGVRPDLDLKRFDLDRYENYIMTTITQAINGVAATRCHVRFEPVADEIVCLIDVERSSRPAYVKNDKGNDHFFVRAGNTTRALDTEDIVHYTADRFGIS